MLINTAVFGSIEVKKENIFSVPEGILGFEDSFEYALITKQEQGVTLRWFQAADSEIPCFVVFDAFEIISDYSPVIEASDLRALGCKKDSDLTYLVIAVIPDSDDISEITVNLKSPIVLNRKNNIARQVILANPGYPIRFPLGIPQDNQVDVAL